MTMKIGLDRAAIGHLGHLFGGESVVGMGEVQLLERFVARRDEPAFAALVARHGPMVLSVCRRLLADPHDVEDAFQATFLVLVRRAGSLRDRDRLAPWLFGVARRVAGRARRDAARRRDRERPGAEASAESPGVDEHRRELGRALVEEIERLPESLRSPVVLCCADGLSYDEAADRIGCSPAAIRGRLARARDRLKGRLTRRGFAPALGAVASLLASGSASAAVPALLHESTTRAAIAFAAGRSATAGMVPASVAALAEGVIRTMSLTRSKFLAAAVMACGISGYSVMVIAQDGPAEVKVRANGLSEADRLGSVEQKLDRVLRALEGPNRPSTPPIEMKTVTRVPEMVLEMDLPVPSFPPPDLPATGKMRSPMPVMGGMPGMMGMGPVSKGTDVRMRTVMVPNERLNALESRLLRLEARLTEVEMRLGSTSQGSQGIRFETPAPAARSLTLPSARDAATTKIEIPRP